MFGKAKQWMIAASVIGAIPVVLFLWFALGEGLGGAMHVVEAVTVGALIALGWFRPQIAAVALVIISLLFETIFGYRARAIELLPTLGILILFVLPILISGILFFFAYRKSASSGGPLAS